MNDERGLYQKYWIMRISDRSRIDDAFVLRPKTDRVARKALRVYAAHTKNRQLATDILDWLDLIEQGARKKPDWRPKPPNTICGCGKPMTQRAAYQDDDGWFLFWDCPDLCGDADDYEPIEWPFEHRNAFPEHLTDLGFVIVV